MVPHKFILSLGCGAVSQRIALDSVLCFYLFWKKVVDGLGFALVFLAGMSMGEDAHRVFLFYNEILRYVCMTVSYGQWKAIVNSFWRKNKVWVCWSSLQSNQSLCSGGSAADSCILLPCPWLSSSLNKSINRPAWQDSGVHDAGDVLSLNTHFLDWRELHLSSSSLSATCLWNLFCF